MEVYKDIAGYEGLYQVSNMGNVKSLSRKNGHGTRNANRILTIELDKRAHTNYHRVTLSKEGKVKKMFVHRLVAAAFIPTNDLSLDVNHKDNNGENNNVSNLEWCTCKENMEHSSKQGRQNLVRSLGGKARAKLYLEENLLKFKSVLGTSFIEYHQGKRSFVSFSCKECGTITKKRADSSLILLGVCSRKCKNKLKDLNC